MFENRYHLIPQALHERALVDPIIYAAIAQFNQSDMTVTEFFTRLVLALADERDRLFQREVERLTNNPGPWRLPKP
jgi:hypothetical protein